MWGGGQLVGSAPVHGEEKACEQEVTHIRDCSISNVPEGSGSVSSAPLSAS